MYGKKAKDIPAHHAAAEQRTQHGEGYRYHKGRLNDPKRRIFPTAHASEPAPVQGMVDDKQRQHTGTEPFMDLLSGQHECHQEMCSCTIKKQETKTRDRPPAPHYSEQKTKRQAFCKLWCQNSLTYIRFKNIIQMT